MVLCENCISNSIFEKFQKYWLFLIENNSSYQVIFAWMCALKMNLKKVFDVSYQTKRKVKQKWNKTAIKRTKEKWKRKENKWNNFDLICLKCWMHFFVFFNDENVDSFDLIWVSFSVWVVFFPLIFFQNKIFHCDFFFIWTNFCFFKIDFFIPKKSKKLWFLMELHGMQWNDDGINEKFEIECSISFYYYLFCSSQFLFPSFSQKRMF